jgi:hypothetical protein
VNDRHQRYLAELRARHEADFKALRRALAGRCPEILRQLKRIHADVERQTALILQERARRARTNDPQLDDVGIGKAGKNSGERVQRVKAGGLSIGPR